MMKLGEKIRQYRKQQGLTQEQVADRLGVSTPAVNKWENDNSYPDITLLSPLARLLGTDLNTLLSFRENLTSQELSEISETVGAIFRKKGFFAGFEKGEAYLKEYPNDTRLALCMGRIYAGNLKNLESRNKLSYETRILELMERAGESEEQKTAEAALSWRMHYYAGRGDFEKAEDVLRLIPDTSVDKEELQVSLECKKGDYEKAEEYCVKLLEQKIKGVLNALRQYQNILLEKGEKNQANVIGEIRRGASEFFKCLYEPDKEMEE